MGDWQQKRYQAEQMFFKEEQQRQQAQAGGGADWLSKQQAAHVSGYNWNEEGGLQHESEPAANVLTTSSAIFSTSTAPITTTTTTTVSKIRPKAMILPDGYQLLYCFSIAMSS